MKLLAAFQKEMPTYGNRAIPPLPEDVKCRTPLWRTLWRRSGTSVDWLLFLSNRSVIDAIHILLSAVENRDTRFFNDLARRMQSKCDLARGAEPAISVLAVERMRPPGRRTLSDCPRVGEVQGFLNRKGLHYDERTVRRLMKLTGYKTCGRGAPRKSGNSNP
jgi:hypothetical protein